MNMKTKILNDYDDTIKAFLQKISSFKEEQFNSIPFEGSWTPAQVADHIFKSLSGVVKTLHGATESINREPGEKIDAMKDVFLNFEIKMKSPASILPETSPIEKERILKDLDRTSTIIKEAANNLGLSETCTTFELPGFGRFTRFEWVYFAIFHTKRHLHQLENISKIINKSQ